MLTWFVVVLGCAACGKPNESAAAGASHDAFPVTVPALRDIVITREYVADVRAARHAEVRARIPGVVETVAVDEGQSVKAGQTLFTIHARARQQDVEIAKAAIAAAEAELRAAELEVDNIQLLADENVVSPAELARAKSKADLLAARVKKAKASAARSAVELDRADIRAPFAGVLNRIRYKAGSFIDNTAELTTISDTSEVLAYFSIAEREYLELIKSQSAGQSQKARLRLADGSLFAQEGTIDAVASEIDSATGTIAFRARFPNPDGLVKHGSSAKVVLEKRLRGALVVPQKSTFEVQGDVYVYALDPDNTVRARKISIEEQVDDVFVIESGITNDERFVLEGVQKVKDGERIDVRPAGGSKATTPATRG